jgi:hypothetical protein
MAFFTMCLCIWIFLSLEVYFLVDLELTLIQHNYILLSLITSAKTIVSHS